MDLQIHESGSNDCDWIPLGEESYLTLADVAALLHASLIKAQRLSSVLAKSRGDSQWRWLWSKENGAIGFEEVDQRLIPFLEADRVVDSLGREIS